MTTLLMVEHLKKKFGALVATDDVSLSLNPGECHAVIGPNGAGKTTLIHQLSGKLTPDSGRIIFNGADVTSVPPHIRAHAGLMRSFQITSLIPGFTVLENAALAAQARAGSSFRFFRPAARDQAVNVAALEALDAVGLADRAAAMASELSHGEKRALELAVALAGRPKALLLDEPMAGMGREESRALTEVLVDLRHSLPILLVEHDMEAVFALADRISVLVYGRIVASGTPDQIRADPVVRDAYLGDEADAAVL
ncbi:MAG: ABC transporter ATP-binding protein [Rhodobacteraceae bacterium]|nr:ABC transporter ATP-binding protein [Paracoccaceae bacterium]